MADSDRDSASESEGNDLSVWTKKTPGRDTGSIQAPVDIGSSEEDEPSELSEHDESDVSDESDGDTAGPQSQGGFVAINNSTATSHSAAPSRPLSTSRNIVSEDESDHSQLSFATAVSSTSTQDNKIQIIIPHYDRFPSNAFEDFTGPDRTVRKVLDVQTRGGSELYTVSLADGDHTTISASQLFNYTNGKQSLQCFMMASSRRQSFSKRQTFQSDSDDQSSEVDSSDDDTFGPKRKRKRSSRHQPSRTSTRPKRGQSYAQVQQTYGLDSSDDEPSFLVSDVRPSRRRRAVGNRAIPLYADESGMLDEEPSVHKGSRQSGRSTRHTGAMREVGEDQIQRSDSEPRVAAAPKVINVKEVFKTLPRTDAFRNRHLQQCETCGDGGNLGQMVYCQGCSLAYHKNCLGQRSTRDHLVTKIGPEDFVLQCRRCVRVAQKKEPTAPDQSRCHDCKTHGLSCKAFRSRKTPAQEQKDREMNGGEDPTYPVPSHLINNPANVLFRCVGCFRAFHYEHLPSRADMMDIDEENAAAARFQEYSQDWKCNDCVEAPAKVAGLVAWKPVDVDTYDPTKTMDEISEDDKAYLVRWEKLSYFRAAWMPGGWVWGITASAMRKAFNKRDDAQSPKMRTEDAIPEEYLRADIVLDVAYTSIVKIEGEEIDKARIKEVKKALIKFKGLPYEDAVWESPPSPEDEDRWTDFVTAYNDWVAGKYVHIPKGGPLKIRLDKTRKLDFASKLEKKKQPDNLNGGELMKYQLEGVNWLYYKWYMQNNAILADEMGLGKTIQIIGFMATLVADWNCFPFLVVVPNATCANWRREIKQWAPSLRVVAYFGSSVAKDMAYKYELFPRQSKEPRCHIVVTSFDAAADPGNKRFFRSVPWQALIVDEGQRLKSDKTQLYGALMDLKIPFRILLTGTPLQNNQRELFNLLQFLDDGHNAAAMEQEYAELDNEKIAKLHEMIRPFFLRRTKAQVLTFLPPMAQIILPVSMSLVQKKLYRSILAKNPDLLRALFKERRDLRSSERAPLSNLLMQLRKCLCHPFVYNKSIEERNVTQSVSHRNLVEASGKLQLLEILLPKLQERGSRVLIFSQFLDMLTMVEDFLDGLGMQYGRLDGTMGSLQKQKRIDAFNDPKSELFAFLLSTRAGGVGINLATADTVIILDPDFNPHQDIQALSRAHRIGQKKKVLCFQLVTRTSAEEKIMQIGRGKIALDHILIDQMDVEDASEQDLHSILAHGAAELFSDEGDKEVKYDSAEVDKLLDRSLVEDTKAGEDKSAESQFSFARVWANNHLEDTLPTVEAEVQAPDPGLWDKILKEREKAAAAEAAATKEAFGRGRRAKQAVDYGTNGPGREGTPDVDDNVEEPATASSKKTKKAVDEDHDTDFQADSSDDSSADEESIVDPNDLDGKKTSPKRASPAKKQVKEAPSFKRAPIPPPRPSYGLPSPPSHDDDHHPCQACRTSHARGNCAIKKAGVEYCNLCGTAHFGFARICPHINSETQVRAMLAALKHSPEAGNLVKAATKYLTGVKGTLVQKKKLEEERRRQTEAGGYRPVLPPHAAQGYRPAQVGWLGPVVAPEGYHVGGQERYPAPVSQVGQERYPVPTPQGEYRFHFDGGR